MLTAGEVRRRLAISDPTLRRWSRAGPGQALPAPEFLNGVRVWHEADVEKLVQAKRAMPPRAIPNAAQGRDEHRVNLELSAAAGHALFTVGLARVESVMRQFRVERLADVPPKLKRRLTNTLRKLNEE